MNRDEFSKVPGIRGDLFDLKAMYPERDVFHLTELTFYLKTVIHYFSLTGQFDLA